MPSPGLGDRVEIERAIPLTVEGARNEEGTPLDVEPRSRSSIVDRGMTGIEAVKTSIKASINNFFGLLGLLLINTILSFVGMLFCYVGAFFLIPIMFGSIIIAYDKIFHLHE